MSFWRKVFVTIRKDVISELRTREVVFSVLIFTMLVLIIFNFAFDVNQETMVQISPGILWATFAFAGILSLNRTFILEKESGCLEGLMACPSGQNVIYTAKMLGSLLLMMIVEAIALAIFTLLFDIPVFSVPLVVIILLASVGFAAVGTLFSALAVNTRAREMILPILFLPVVAPVIISAVKASALALSGGVWADLAPWLQLIGAFDIIFLIVSFLVFPFVVEE
jgi:heme exporter protein B